VPMVGIGITGVVKVDRALKFPPNRNNHNRSQGRLPRGQCAHPRVCSNFQIGNHPATAQRERNHTRCIGKKLLAITNPFGASAQG